MDSWLSPEREEKFRQVATSRQGNLTVLLENVHDIHNIAAVVRSCDAVGIKEIFILYSDPRLQKDKIKIGTNASVGARKWVDVHFFHQWKACHKVLKKTYDLVLCSAIEEEARPLYDLDLTRSLVLVFGNEHDGISQDILKEADGTFWIPQAGMAQSLNISVACAVTLFEAFRQRREKGFFEQNPTLSERQKKALLKEYQRRHLLKLKNKFARKKRG